MTVRVCNEPGCPELVDGDSKCEHHRKDARRRSDAKRPSASRRGYGRRWATEVREPFLRYFPVCVDCGEKSEVPDHDPISRAELVRRGVPNPDAFEFLKPRCTRCHNSRTGRDEGAFAKPKEAR